VETRRVVGNVPAKAREARRLGPADPGLPMERMILVLSSRDPEGLDRFLAAQQDPSSPDFHRWLSPKTFGERFGADGGEIERLSRWLGQQGFDVEAPPAGHLALVFSGTAERVESVFGTRIVELEYEG